MAQLKSTVVQGNLSVTDTTYTTNLNLASATASKAILTDANKNLVSGTVPVNTGGTGGTSFTANSVIMSGSSTTAAFTTRAITNNTSATAVTASTNLITANTLYYHIGNSNITTLGTITTGTWSATVINPNKGGTGVNSYAKGDILYAGAAIANTATTALSKLTIGSSGQVLQTTSSGIPGWITATDANTASTIVKRDSSGNFSAGTITAALSGNADSATVLYTGAPTSSTSGDIVGAIQAYWNANKSTIIRNKGLAFCSTHSTVSMSFGYFLSGYDSTPYGGFFSALYNTPYYIGVNNGTFTQQTILTSTNYTTYCTPANIGAATSGHNHDSVYLKLSGGTMTGVLTLKGEQYNDNYALNANNSNIIGINQLRFNDAAETYNEGIMFPNGTGYDCMVANGGTFHFRSATDGTPTVSLANSIAGIACGTINSGSVIIKQPATARNQGVFGTYDASRAAVIWGMGTGYNIAADGSGLGTFYGAAYGYQGQAYLGSNNYAGGHQFLWCQNGAVNVALGTNIWTSGAINASGGIIVARTAGTENHFIARATGYSDSATLDIKLMVGSGKTNHGIYSTGYSADGTAFTSDGKWMVYRNSSGDIILNGNASTASGLGCGVWTNNVSSYGNVKLTTARGNYYGILFGPADFKLHVMANSAGGGIFTESKRWVIYHQAANNVISIGSATVDTNYTITLDGSVKATGEFVSQGVIRSLGTGEHYVEAQNTTTTCRILIDSAGDGNHGLWSNGYYDTNGFHSSNMWVLRRGTSNWLYLGGTTMVQGSLYTNNSIVNRVANPWPTISFGTLATTTTYTTVDQNTWAIIFYQASAKNNSSNSWYAPSFCFRQYSYTASSTTRLSYYENYWLPTVASGLTVSPSYNILTSKGFVGINSSWNTARNNAQLRMTTIYTGGYSPILSVKTTNGSWEMGEYDNTNFSNYLLFTYVTDTQYSTSGANYTAQLRLSPAGYAIYMKGGETAYQAYNSTSGVIVSLMAGNSGLAGLYINGYSSNGQANSFTSSAGWVIARDNQGANALYGTVVLKTGAGYSLLYGKGTSQTSVNGYFGLYWTDKGANYSDNRFRALYYSYNSSTFARLNTYEYYDLPAVTANLGASVGYSIITTKNASDLFRVVGWTCSYTISANSDIHLTQSDFGITTQTAKNKGVDPDQWQPVAFTRIATSSSNLVTSTFWASCAQPGTGAAGSGTYASNSIVVVIRNVSSTAYGPNNTRTCTIYLLYIRKTASNVGYLYSNV